jgi:hypothetical protein
MTMRIYLVGGLNGGAGRSLTAALLACGLHLHGRQTLLVRQAYDGLVATLDPLERTLPLPWCKLMLPPAHALPADLAGMQAMIDNADTRFMTALHRLAMDEVGEDADIVIDLCCHERALNPATVRDATLLLIPVRTSVLEIDWAVRGFAYARHLQRSRGLAVPTLLAAIAPDNERASQQELLSSLLRDCGELLPGEASEMVVETPFLDAATLLDLFDERPIWQNPQLIARCHAFAAAAMAHADAFITMLAEQVDDL